jgi:hypothetical protein
MTKVPCCDFCLQEGKLTLAGYSQSFKLQSISMKRDVCAAHSKMPWPKGTPNEVYTQHLNQQAETERAFNRILQQQKLEKAKAECFPGMNVFLVEGWLHPTEGGDDKRFSFTTMKATLEEVNVEAREYMRKRGSADLADYRITAVEA